MKTTTVIALSLMLGLITIPLTYAAEDPFDDGFGDILAELETLETESDSQSSSDSTSSDELQSSSPEASDDSSETQETLDSSEPSTTSKVEAKQVNSRSYMPEIPEGKENYLLYSIPGAIEYRGMTFMHINSRKFFNKFQKCSTPETAEITNTLSRLKISQGAPLECREDMQYNFLPYKTFRTKR